VLVRELDNILKEHEFKLIEDARIKELDLIYYNNNKINVFLGNQNYLTVGYEEINNLAYHLRERLIEKDINIYNSYLLYCIDNDGIKDEDIILLERSSKYLRKYVIRQYEDIERIFFLNNISNKIDNEIKIYPQMNEDIKSIVDQMIDDEKILRLNTKKIDLIAKNIIDSLGESNEN
jgi:hypothetical protein